MSAIPIIIFILMCLMLPAILLVDPIARPILERRLGRVLRAHQDELARFEGDPTAPPKSDEGPATLTAEVMRTSRYGPPKPVVELVQTFAAPILAILRATARDDLESVTAYLAPSVLRHLQAEPNRLPAVVYLLGPGNRASFPDYQVQQALIMGKDNALVETWTLVRRKRLILCRICGGSVSGAFGEKCATCASPCDGFEAGWLVLEIPSLSGDKVQPG